MNQSEFLSLLEEGASFGEIEIQGLQALSSEYPYFQTAQLLLTKAFHESQNLNFEKQLRKSAAYASDRKKLHQLIFAAPKVEPKLEEIKQEEEDPIVKLEEEALASEENKEIKEREHDLLDQQILSSAINSSIFLEVPDEINFADFQDLDQGSKKAATKEEPAEESSRFNESEGHSFADWMNFFSDNKEEKSKILWEEDEDDEDEGFFTEINSGSQLPAKNDFYSPAKMARLSVQEDDDLITETLANVYADQGNFEKAIKAFQKLQLKYPEKKIYFAGRIKEIENQINSI